MKVTYTIALADIKAAQRLAARQTLGSRISSVLLNIVVPIGAVLGLVLGPFLHLTDRSPQFLLIAIAGFELFLIYLSIAVPISRFSQIRKSFKRLYPPNRTDRTFSIDIDDERILSAMPGFAEAKFFWTAIVAFVQDDKVTMLYTSKTNFLMFPTSALSRDQRLELSQLAARNIARKEK
jgi:hypothetical protein